MSPTRHAAGDEASRTKGRGREPGEGPSPRAIVFDDSCGMCKAAVAALARSGAAPGIAFTPFSTLRDAEARRLLDQGFQNEVITFDPTSGTVWRGAEGLLRALEHGPLRWLARALRSHPVFPVTRFVYATIARNRRVIAPPPPLLPRCDCDPEPHRGYQAAFIVLTALLAVAIAASAALLLPPSAEVHPVRGALLAAGSGLFASATCALFVGGGRGMAYLAGASWTLLAMSPLLPLAALVARALPERKEIFAYGVAAAIAVTLARRMQSTRIRALDLPTALVLVLPASVLAGAALA